MRFCGRLLFVTCLATGPVTGVACQPQAPKAVVPFVENDFARALAEAKATGRPLFVEVGTAWCPPCQQLAREVFPDPALATLRDAFVWLSIDADASSNEPFLARFPARGFPTLYVIEPASEKVVVTEAGGTTTSMLRVMLLASQKAIAMARTNPKDDATAAERWSSALDAASQDAPGLDLRIAFDRRRLLAYAALGAVERILPSLERSEHDLPTSADPPMLIAYVDWKLGRLDDARGALARAKMRLAGEPAQRTLDVYLLEADVARAAGDVRGERAALVEGLARTKGAPLSKAEDASRNKLRLRLSSLPP